MNNEPQPVNENRNVQLVEEVDQIERWTHNARVTADELYEKNRTQRKAVAVTLRLNRIHREVISLMEYLGVKPS